MAHSTAKTAKQKAVKPEKPYPDFPLFAHATKRWAKKIRGKMHYFGRWDDWQGALEQYQLQRDDLYAGRKPRVSVDTYCVVDLCNEFLTSKDRLAKSGEITGRTFYDYHATCGRIVEAFGGNRPVDDLRPEDFAELREAWSKKWGPTTLANEIQRTRVLFGYGYKQGKLDRPVPFGEEFKRPSKKVLRRNRREKGKRMFQASELRLAIEKANQPLKAMLLLAANGGLGQSDCAALPLTVLEDAIETGWLDFPRPKTEVDRRFPLWPETIDACKDALFNRPKPAGKEESKLAFLTRRGARWVKSRQKVDEAGNTSLVVEDAVGREFAKLLTKLELKRPGLNFYGIRHGFETIGGNCRDQVAVNHVMGHADSSMAAEYREHVDDARLQTVANTVHAWLFPVQQVTQ